MVREALAGTGPRDARARHALEDAEEEAIAQRGEPRRLRGPLHAQQVGRDPHARDRGEILRPCAIPALLTSAEDLRSDPDAGTDPEGPGPGRSVHVVGRQAQEVDPPLVDEQGDPPHRADAVYVQGHSVASREPPDLADRLDRTDLPAGRRQRNEARLGADRLTDSGGIDSPLGVHPDVRHRMPALLQIAAGVKDGDMLDGGGHDVTAGSLLGRSAHGEVVGLGGAGGEDDPGRAGPHEPGNLGAGSAQGRARLDSKRMRGRRVSDTPLEEGPHEREDARVDRGESTVVEVDPQGVQVLRMRKRNTGPFRSAATS